MFRTLLGLVSALALVLAASGLAPRVATAQEKDDFNCPIEKICFYEDEGYNFNPAFDPLEDPPEEQFGDPEVVMDPPAPSERCVRLEDEKVPFLAGSGRNNTDSAYLDLFADDNCRTPVEEPMGGVLDPGDTAPAIRDQAKSFIAVDLSAAPETPETPDTEAAEQQPIEVGGLAGDALGNDDQFLVEQEPAAQLRRDVREHSSGELGHERARARRVQGLVRKGRAGRESAGPVGTTVQQLAPAPGVDQQPHSSRLPGSVHEVEQGVVRPVHVLGRD